MKQSISLSKIFVLIIFFLFISDRIMLADSLAQDDPVLSPEVVNAPVIDGLANDSCWLNVPWQNIDQVWIPYGGSYTEEDFKGRYKVVWSSVTNLLYFLVETEDDVFVDGWTLNSWTGIYEYDITEVFIDENDSGGEHRLDTDTSNGENAFAYHMYSAYPVPGQVNTECYIEDRAGTSSNWRNLDYRSHFPEFALRVDGNIAVREFSLIVFNDTYTAENPEAAVATLFAGIRMGLSLAYCDNDNPNEIPKTRENMFGSVWEPSPGNLHWMNADTFGNIELTSGTSSIITDGQTVNESFELYDNYPNPFNPSTNISFFVTEPGHYSLKVYDMLGGNIVTLINERLHSGKHSVKFEAENLSSNIYFYELSGMNKKIVKKMLFLK